MKTMLLGFLNLIVPCVLWRRIITLKRVCSLSCLALCFVQEKRRLAIRNAAQQWEGVRACLELPSTNGAKEEVSPENSPAHSPAQTNGLAQEPSPDDQRYTPHPPTEDNNKF